MLFINWNMIYHELIVIEGIIRTDAQKPLEAEDTLEERTFLSDDPT